MTLLWFEGTYYNLESAYKIYNGTAPKGNYNYTLYFPDNCSIELDSDTNQDEYELVRAFLKSVVKLKS
jgi:hypothetical protein